MAADKFELFRLSLLLRKNPELLSEPPEKLSREDYLRRVFNLDQPFSHYGSDFHYKPAPDNQRGSALIGRVGRKINREENTPPAEGLVEFTHEAWRAAVIVLDPTHHDDGQKLAVQLVKDVGTPELLVKTLVSAINDNNPSSPYVIEASQIIEEQSFWNFVEKNKGDVTSVTLSFIAPNMFGGAEEIDKEMKAFRDGENASKVDVKIANPEGLQPDTPKIRGAVKYAARGGGKIKARAKGNKTFDSSKSVKRSYIDGVKESGAELINAARSLVKKILGRDE